MDKLSTARGRILLRNAFFGTLLMSTPMEMVPDEWFKERGFGTPTAATNMDKIFYSESFFEKLSIDQIMFVLAHEVMHIALEHGMRLAGRNPILWNISADYAINLILKDSDFKVITEADKIPGFGGSLLDEQYRGMTADQIYEKLKNQSPPQGGGGAGKGDAGMKQDGLGQDVQAPDNMDAEGRAKAERSIQQRVAAAASVARAAGHLSGDLERIVNDILNPQVPWPELLREYMTRIVKDDESWGRRNRRFGHVYLPARHSVRMGEIIFIGDTSGSIGQEELDKVAAEINAVADLVQPECIRAIWADARVKHEEVFELGDPLKLHPMGGGGTDMRVPLKHVEQYDPEVVVMVTDGYTPWIEETCPFPLIVLCTTDVELPFCDLIKI